MRREAVVGQCFPFNKMRYRDLAAGEKANFRLDLIGVTGIGGKHQDRSI